MHVCRLATVHPFADRIFEAMLHSDSTLALPRYGVGRRFGESVHLRGTWRGASPKVLMS